MRYTRFEKARVVGARALQISLGAPVLVEKPKELIDPLRIAILEYDANVIPIAPKKNISKG
ncbi:MAG: DNA-directed RNA polymerase subunit K [Thermoplasmata archaeon]